MMNQYMVVISIDGLAQHYLNDPKCKAPNLRHLMKKGAAAKGMESIYPTMTWAIHSSLVTGTYPKKHGIIGNWSFDREQQEVACYAGEFYLNKEEMLKQEPYYDLAKKMGWTTASICWPVTKGADHIDFNIPEFYNQELFESFSTSSFWNELKEAGLPMDHYAAWSLDHSRGHMQDWLTAEVSKYLIKTHKPNLMQLHFLLPDSYQHDYGSGAEEIFWSIDYVDRKIGEVMDALKQEGIYEQTDIFIVSDHGFKNFTNVFNPNALFEQKGWFSGELHHSKVLQVSQAGSAFIYIQEEETTEHAKLVKEIQELLQEHSAIETIFTPEQFEKLGIPTREQNPRYAPDLVLEASDDWTFEVLPSQIEPFLGYGHSGIIEKKNLQTEIVTLDSISGAHGYLPAKDIMKAVFIAAGPSIREGIELPSMKIIDVAPTIANIIGEALTNADGRVLEEIIKVKSKEISL
ncbi:ectonucleotide pyrophosphatase/phosphodiesterase [Bacillus gobiensis]|uniref:alkaline phosphatase family protein n=1 Tax=Bacillus gobiensis TaxID=1441095 RepID=UPI003D1BCAF1